MACDPSPLTPRDVLLEFLRTFARERHLAGEIDILRVRLDELADCLQVVYTRHGLTGVYGYSECGLTNVLPRTVTDPGRAPLDAAAVVHGRMRDLASDICTVLQEAPGFEAPATGIGWSGPGPHRECVTVPLVRL